jgi:hypothetical protein
MAHNYGVKITTVDFSNMSGGINTTDPVTDIRDNQVQYGLNAVFTNKGFSRCGGLVGLKSSQTFDSLRGYGLHIYEKSDGSEEILCVAGQKLYTVTTAGVATELYDFGAEGEAYFANYMGICFVCNGTKLVKYDGTNAYQCGIAAPSAGNAAATSGGSLPAGVYQIYIGYARKVSGSNVLYGSGYSLGSVTLSGADLSVAITNFANSSDPQVNNKVVWMTDADGGTFYFYYETGNNTTTSFTITSDSAKDDTRQYDVLAAYNFVPVSPQYVFVSDNRVIYTSGRTAYFSLQAGTVYDLEKFDTGADGNILTFPYNIAGGFTIGNNWCFNTTSGVIVLPNGDISQAYEIKGAPYYFKYFRTVGNWNQIAIGLTNDGVRIFDGNKFTNVNISRDIKTEIERCYTGSNDTFSPCGKVIRNANNDRTEYALSFIDTNVSGYINNRTWVLDLDSLNLESPDSYNTQWEQWENGFSYIDITKDGTIYCMQSKGAESNIIKFSSDSTADKWIFDENGVWISSLTNRKMHIITKEKIPDLLGYCRWMYLHMFGLAAADLSFKVRIGDEYTRESIRSFVHGSLAQPLFDVALMDVAVFGENTPIKNKKLLNKKMKGNSVFIEIEQTADDNDLNFNRVYLTGIIKRTRTS